MRAVSTARVPTPTGGPEVYRICWTSSRHCGSFSKSAAKAKTRSTGAAITTECRFLLISCSPICSSSGTWSRLPDVPGLQLPVDPLAPGPLRQEPEQRLEEDEDARQPSLSPLE